MSIIRDTLFDLPEALATLAALALLLAAIAVLAGYVEAGTMGPV